MTEGYLSPFRRRQDFLFKDLMSDTTESLKQTPLYALHVELGAKLVPFAGYAMPVQYPAGVLKEHLHTREKAGLFDVSHMGQAFLSGADPARALERLTPADLAGLPEGMQRYGLLLNDKGGIKDDFMTTRLAGETALYLVVNAATKDGDFAYMAGKLKDVAELKPQPQRALLALQGPMAADVLERLSPGISALTFMQAVRADIAGVPAIVSRTGYTGEDGFEISLEGQDAERVARALLADDRVLPIGLGARDSLRLEAGLCLYGHDMDDAIDPVEASLTWSMGKRRKEERDFPGAERIMEHLLNGADMKRVGLRPEGRAPAREGTEIADKAGRVIGRVTSGGFGPSLNAPVAMGYVERQFSTAGTKLDLLVRGRAMPAEVTAMPFVPNRYKRASK
jgi:aminomethyltransferase